MSTPPVKYPAPSLRFTCMLAALLFIPFGIKLMILEPYPAVIMPSGSGRIDISEGTYRFTYYRAYGITSSNAREALNVIDLIQPAHDQYLYTIFKNDFGIGNDSQKTIQLRGTNWAIASYQQAGATPQHKADYRSALNTQLSNRFEQLLLEQVTVLGDIKTRNWIQEDTDESTLIEL